MASAFLSSSQWVKRMEEFFDQSDYDESGDLSIEDFYVWIQNIKEEVNPDTILLEKLRKAATDYWETAGMKPGLRFNKKDFVEMMANYMASSEVKKFFIEYINAAFDAVDTNHDGYLSLDEYKKFLKASNFDDNAADIAFQIVDKNNDGRILRKELIDFNYDFWFIPDDQASAGLYGPNYN